MIYIGILMILIFMVFVPDRKRNDISYYLLFLILTLTAGLRYRVGGDSLSYMDSFNSLPRLGTLLDLDYTKTEYNPFWYVFNALIKEVYDDFIFFQFVHAVFLNGVVFWFCSKYCQYKYVAILIYYVFYFIYFNMEILRESLAMAVFLLAVPSLLAKKWIKYYSLALIALLIHTSAIILFILPFLFRDVKRKYFFLIVIVLALLPFFDLKNLFMIFSFTDQIALKVNSYISREINIYGMLMQLLLILPVMIFQYIRKKNHFETHVFEKNVTPYIFIGFLSLAIGGFYRFLNYISLLNVIYMVDTFCQIIRSKNTSRNSLNLARLSFLMLITYQTYYYSRDTSEYKYGTRFYMFFSPYHSIFDPKIEQNREQMYFNLMDVDKQ